MAHTPTDEQQAIIDFAKKEKRSLLIKALAGTAKTTTLEMMANALEDTPILFIAFAKRNQLEALERLPPNAICKTVNGVGHGVWGSAVGKRLTVNKDKLKDIFKARSDSFRGADRQDMWEMLSDVMQTLRLAKQAGYVPPVVTVGKPLISQEDFYASLEEIPSDFLVDTVDHILAKSIAQAYEGVIDFDDQIYMPVVFGGSFPRFPLVMVDEAQDLSSINHKFVEKLVSKRLAAVGDPWQSIYGFRGAVASGMSELQRRFDMAEFGLSVSFRCPQNVIRRVHGHVPHMRWPAWAIEGRVDQLAKWKISDIQDGAVIICRNNAPLFSIALQFLKAGRAVSLAGQDIGPGLVKILKKFGPLEMRREDIHKAIADWTQEALAKSRSEATVYDKAECLTVFADAGETLEDAIGYAENIFKMQGRVSLMSGHKSKGLEWDTVFHLDPWRLPSKYALSPEAVLQEENLRYVITTRAKREYIEIDARGLE